MVGSRRRLGAGRARVFDPDAPQIVQASDVSLNLGDTAAAAVSRHGHADRPEDAAIWAQYGRLDAGDRTVGRAALERALALGATGPSCSAHRR